MHPPFAAHVFSRVHGTVKGGLKILILTAPNDWSFTSRHCSSLMMLLRYAFNTDIQEKKKKRAVYCHDLFRQRCQHL